jgi:hypothetical protein
MDDRSKIRLRVSVNLGGCRKVQVSDGDCAAECGRRLVNGQNGHCIVARPLGGVDGEFPLIGADGADRGVAELASTAVIVSEHAKGVGDGIRRCWSAPHICEVERLLAKNPQPVKSDQLENNVPNP